MRVHIMAIGLLAVAACTHRVPDSGAGVGFNEYSTYRAGDPAADAAEVPPVPDGQPISEETASAEVSSGAGRSAAISDEQDFQAVAERETIESDAERLAEVRSQYEVVTPTAVPEREGGGGSPIVEYALATSNPVGHPIFRRSGFLAERRFTRNCAEYTSPDMAQEDFLRRGGPERDPKGLDPDGDGYACWWDPTPFRQAQAAAAVDNVPVAPE